MWRALLSLAFCLVVLNAHGDGKVFPSAAIASPVTIPDQRALICYSNGVERLVIETRFAGEGTNFGWVVPLPSQPTIERATPGLFPTVSHLTQPELRHYVTRWYLGILALVGIGWLGLTLRSLRPLHWTQAVALLLVIASAAAYSPLAGIVVGVFSLAAVALVRWSGFSPLTMLLLIALGMLMAGLLLPPMARSKAGPAASTTTASGVSILERSLVGEFETTTIAATDAAALFDWLIANGYRFGTNTQPVIRDYVREGWVFVAAKLRRELISPGIATNALHPLCFTFKADRAVYPLRLTGVDNGPLSLELYVFGDARARVPGLEIDYCQKALYSPPTSGWLDGVRDRLLVGHAGLRRWVEPAPVVTRLAGTLSPGDMTRDATIEWVPFRAKKSLIYSAEGARNTALNASVSCVVLGLVVAFVVGRQGRGRERRIPAMVWAGALVAGIVFFAVYFGLPRTEIRLVRHPSAMARAALVSHATAVLDAGPCRDLATARAAAAQALREPPPDPAKSWENRILGGEIREEDSPGNYVIRERDGRLEYVGHDSVGREYEVTELIRER